MARTIDEKIVVLKFDNSNFERNTKETMSTLDKLKAKLNFGDSSKSLDKLSESANKVNMKNLSNSVDEVGRRFSAMEVIGVTALANITNSAVNAGKALLSSITIDPIKSGWNKMSELMASVQTLKNSTGLATEEIEQYLNTLMWYSDETSYSFTDMTSALATMTSSGGDIEKLIPMITGIANSVAFAGKGANEFAITIRNLTQSYSKGHLDLIDWKSLQLANTNSKALKQTLIDAGVKLGKIKEGQVDITNFETSFGDKRSGYWATTEVMEEAFNRWSQLTMAVAEAEDKGWYYLNEKDSEGKQKIKDYTTAAEAIEDFANGAAISIDKVGQAFDDVAVRGFRAAQEAKTFKEAIAATADATASAWMQVFTSIFGNFDEQKQIWTNLANYLYDVFVEPIYTLQEKIENALDFSGFKEAFDKVMDSKLIQNILKIQEGISGIDNVTKKTSKSLKEYQDIVYKVWRGDYGNMYPRWNALDKMGYDSRVVQRLVDRTEEIAGYGKGWTVINKLTEEDVIKYEKKYGITVENTNEAIEDQIDVTKDLNDALESLTDDQLKEMGLDEDQIDLYRQLERGASKYRDIIYQLTGTTGIPALMDIMTSIKGRDLLFGAPKIDTSKDGENELGLHFEKVITDEEGNEVYQTIGAFTALLRTFKNVLIMVKDAWAEVFHFDSVDLYMTILKFQQFANHIYDMTRSVQGMKNLKDTFKGLFAVLRLIVNVVHAPLKIAWTIFKTVLETCGMTVLEFTGALGNLLSKFVDFVIENEFIIKGITQLAKVISEVVIAVYQWVQSQISLNGALEKVSKGFKKFYDKFKTWLSGMKGKSIDEIIDYIWNSLVRAYNRVKNFLVDKIKNLPSTLLGALKSVKDSISNWFNGIGDAKSSGKLGSYIIKGLINGLKGGAKGVYQAIKSIAIGLIDTFKTMFGIHSPSKLFITLGGFLIAGLAIGIKDAGGNVFTAITNIGNGILDRIKSVFTWIMDLFGESGQAIIRTIKQIDLSTIITALLTAGAIATLFTFAKGLSALASGLKSLVDLSESVSLVLKKFAGVLTGIKYRLIGAAFHDLARAILEIAIAVLILSKIESGKMWEIFAFITLITLLLGGVLALLAKISKVPDDKKVSMNMVQVIGGIIAISVAMLLMAIAIKKLATLKLESIWNLVLIVGALVAFIISLKYLTKFQKDVGKIGTMLLGLGVAMYLMAKAIKMLGVMNPADLAQGIFAIAAMLSFIIVMMYATKFLSKNNDELSKFGNFMMKISVAILLMGLVVKSLGKMKFGDLAQGLGALVVIGAIIAGLIWIATKADNNLIDSNTLTKLGKLMMEMAVSFLLIAISIGILGKMKIGTLVQGLAVIAIVMVGLGKFIKQMQKNKITDVAKVGGMLAGLALAILGIAVSLTLLSLVEWNRLLMPLAALGVVFVGLYNVLKQCSNLFGIDWKSIIAIAGIIAVVAIALAGLSLIEPERLLMPMFALITVLLTIKLFMESVSKIGDSKEAMKNLIIIGVFIAAIGGIIVGLSFLDPLGVITATTGLSILLLSLGACFTIISNLKFDEKQLLKFVGFSSLLLFICGAIILGLSVIDSTNVIPNAIGLAILLGACTLVMIALDKIVGKVDPTSLASGVIGLLLVLTLCYVAVAVLKTMDEIQNAESNVKSLVVFMLGMSAVLIAVSLVGALIAAMGGLGALAGLASLAGILGLCFLAILVLKKMDKVKDAERNTNLLVNFMNKMTIILVKIGIIGPLALMAVAAIGALLTLITVFGVIVTAFGALASKFPSLQTFIDVGIELFIKLAEGIGKILAAFITGFVGGLMELLPKLGAKLSQFMVNAMPFIMGCKLITKQTLGAVGILTAAILGLTASSLISGIVSWLPFSKSFAEMGSDLSAFMTNAKGFISGIKIMDPVAVSCTENLATAILKLTAANLLNGLADFLGSPVSLADFGREIGQLGTGMRRFVKNIGTFGEEELHTTETASEAIVKLADAGSKMRKTGGLLQLFTGTQEDLGSFAKNLPIVGAGIKLFIDSLTNNGKKSFGDQQLKTCETGAKVIASLAEAASKVPDTGFSFKRLFAGGPGDLEEFTTNFPKYAIAIRKFIDVLNGEQEVVTGFNGAVPIITKLPATAESAFKMSDDISKFMDAFGKFIESLSKLKEGDDIDYVYINGLLENLPSIGELLRKFMMSLNGVHYETIMDGEKAMFKETIDDPEQTARLAGEQAQSLVTMAVDLITSLAGLKGIKGSDLDAFMDFAPKMQSLGIYINAFIDSLLNGWSFGDKSIGNKIDISNTDKIVEIVKAGVSIVEQIGKLGGTDFSNMNENLPTFNANLKSFAEKLGEFVTQMNTIKKEDIDSAKEKMAIIKTISDDLNKQLDEQKDIITSNFQTYFAKIIDGMYSKNETLKTAVTSEATKMLEGFKNALDGTGSKGKKSLKDEIYEKVTGIANEAIKRFYDSNQTVKDGVITAGNNILQGLLDGLSNIDKIKSINTQAYNIGSKVIENLNKGAGNASPSKLARQSGNYVIEGLIIGIEEYSSRVYDLSYQTGQMAVDGLNEAVAMASSLMETNDTLNPVITPVLDLSNIQTGISNMNSMFNNSQVGVLSNLRTIDSEMNSRNQNGHNYEVVSAINKLGKSLDDNPRNVYNVNGITYDGSSSVNDAVQQLINAIEVERRV